MAKKAKKRTRPVDTARQQKLEAIRAEQARRARRVSMAITAVVVVVVVVIAMLVTKAIIERGHNGSPTATPLASKVVRTDLANIPQSVYDSIGPGSATSTPKPIPKGKLVTTHGKPRIFYVGGEFCPFCAAERWAMVAALNRFGHFSHLGEITSAGSPEYAPDTATLSFEGATYTSKYISFKGYETYDRDHNRLDTLPTAEGVVFTKFDNPPYVSSANANTIPFVFIGGKYMISGASYDPIALQGLSHKTIANALSDPTRQVTEDIIGGANLFTAAICATTHNQPSSVCDSVGVTAAATAMSNAK